MQSTRLLTRNLKTSTFQHTRLLGQKIKLRYYSAAVDKECYLEHLDNKDSGITLLTLDRPKAKNALSRKLLNELAEAINTVRFGTPETGTPATRVLILRSKVEGVFCAGADLKVISIDDMSPTC